MIPRNKRLHPQSGEGKLVHFPLAGERISSRLPSRTSVVCDTCYNYQNRKTKFNKDSKSTNQTPKTWPFEPIKWMTSKGFEWFRHFYCTHTLHYQVILTFLSVSLVSVDNFTLYEPSNWFSWFVLQGVYYIVLELYHFIYGLLFCLNNTLDCWQLEGQTKWPSVWTAPVRQTTFA